MFQEYITSNDTSKQADLLKQMQELIGQDVPVIYLFNPAQVIGASPKLKGYTPHPLERDKYTPDIYVA
jgi:ABC-type transport system substrate-binding protein